MEQRERFGAACLAVCLQHDSDFCREFVNQICGLPRTNVEWLVDVDPYRERAAAWADILLRSKNSAIVIECKVHDDLGSKQDPWRKRQEFMRADHGYGWYFREEFNHKRRTYVTLTESRTDEPNTIAGTACRATTWTNLRALSKPSKWLKDLFLSLGSLDYPAFRSMKTENIHVDDIERTLACHEVLTSVALRLGLKDWRIEHYAEEVNEKDGTVIRGYIGVEICGFRTIQRKKDHIKKLLQPTTKYQAWFGYGLDPSLEGSVTNLSVWFYCGTTKAQNRVRNRVGRIKGWRIVPTQTRVKTSEKHFVQYRSPTTGGRRDEEQFIAVLASVIPEVGSAVGPRGEELGSDLDI